MPRIFVRKNETMDLCQFMESLEGRVNRHCLFFLKSGDDPLIEEMVYNALASQCEFCHDGEYDD